MSYPSTPSTGITVINYDRYKVASDKSWIIDNEPMVHLDQNKDHPTRFKLYVLGYLPTNISNPPVLLFSEDIVFEPIDETEVATRELKIVFDAPEGGALFDIWQLIVEYEVTSDLVPLLIVKYENLDPKTSRGTITTAKGW